MDEAPDPTAGLDEQGLSCLCSGLRRAARVATRRYDEALRPVGLTITQFDLLSALWRSGPATVKVLAEALLLDRTTLSRDLNPLERDGLVELTVGQDRRSRVVRLTKQGATTLRLAAPLWQTVQTDLEGRLGMAVVRSLLHELEEVVDATQHR